VVRCNGKKKGDCNGPAGKEDSSFISRVGTIGEAGKAKTAADTKVVQVWRKLIPVKVKGADELHQGAGQTAGKRCGGLL